MRKGGGLEEGGSRNQDLQAGGVPEIGVFLLVFAVLFSMCFGMFFLDVGVSRGVPGCFEENNL